MNRAQYVALCVDAAKSGTGPLWFRAGLHTVHRELDLFARLKSEQPNAEGITFREWLFAARPADAQRYYESGRVTTMGRMADLRVEFAKEVSAWLAGEDPTDWRAELAARVSS